MTTGRERHYADFLTGPDPRRPPALLVVGNCQAESVRLLLDPAGTTSVRIPPVFELDAHETAVLHAWVGHAAALVAQPVRSDYRDLPLGTAQLADRLPGDARLVVFPIVRYAGLHPTQVVVHHAHLADGSVPLPQPPLVPYHDLRLVAQAVRARSTGAAAEDHGALDPDSVRRVATASLAELRRREAATDVTVAHALEHPGREHMRTVNHPGNPVLLALAAGVAERLGSPAPADPGRRLLDDVRAPIDPGVAACWGFAVTPGSGDWSVSGRPVPAEQVQEVHRRWYAERPDVARAVWDRHRATAETLGL